MSLHLSFEYSDFLLYYDNILITYCSKWLYGYLLCIVHDYIKTPYCSMTILWLPIPTVVHDYITHDYLLYIVYLYIMQS